jgi:hypothetical protein
MPIPFLAFHRKQRFQIPDMTVILFDRLLGQAHKVGTYNGHAHGLAVLPHAGMFETLCLGFH